MAVNIILVRHDSNDYDDDVFTALDAVTDYNVTQLRKSQIDSGDAATLNAADLVIMGRSIPSASVLASKAVWNALTAPVLSMNCYGIRNSRCDWIPTSSCSNQTGGLTAASVTDTSDPVFDGVTGIDSGDWDFWYNNFSSLTSQGSTDAGNGTLLIESDNGYGLLIRWDAGVMYSGGPTAAGPRSFIGAGSDSGTVNYWDWSPAAEQIFFNEVDILSGNTASGPTITDVDTDEDIAIGQTGVVITGSAFEADGANSRVRIDSASDGTGTSQTQTDTSWSDTSIQFTASLGSLSYGLNYLFVRSQSSLENTAGFAINLYLALATTSMSDSTIFDGQTLVEVNGSGFGSSQGSSELYIGSASDGSGTNVVQTITTWTDTKITFTVDIGALSLGTAYVIVGRNQSSLGDSAERLSNAQTISLVAVPTGPVITDVDTDEDIYPTQTGVVITGSSFGSDGANCRVRLNSASNGLGTDQVQTDTSWADTSIQFTASIGSLNYGTNYLFVRDNALAENSTGYAVNLYLPLTTTGLNDSTFYSGQTAIEVDGTDLGSSQGSSKVYLCDSSDGSGVNVEQTVTNWTNTKVTFTAVQGALSLGTVYVIVARNQSSLGDTGERFSNSQSATLLVAPAIPSITSVGADDEITDSEENWPVVGTNFESAQGSGAVALCPTSTYGSAVAQDIVSWSATQINVDTVQGGLSLGTVYLFVTNNSGLRNAVGFPVTMVAGPISSGLFKTSNIQQTITSKGLNVTAFMIRDE